MQKKILIVDDNAQLLELLSLALRQAGFTVAVAENGVEGLAKARSLRPDLMVLDLVLPEMDGYAVCETVRRENALSSMPVIMLTGLTSELTRYAGLESGANEYVKKPVSPAALVSKIRNWLHLPPVSRARQPGKRLRNERRVTSKRRATETAAGNSGAAPGGRKRIRRKIFSLEKMSLGAHTAPA